MTDRRLDGNLVVGGDTVRCRRCETTVGSSEAWLEDALVSEGPLQTLCSRVRAAPETFVDSPVVYRQVFCPGCLTALLTEVIAAADSRLRTKHLAAPTTDATG